MVKSPPASAQGCVTGPSGLHWREASSLATCHWPSVESWPGGGSRKQGVLTSERECVLAVAVVGAFHRYSIVFAAYSTWCSLFVDYLLVKEAEVLCSYCRHVKLGPCHLLVKAILNSFIGILIFGPKT